jgi:hypothetical protein
LAATPPVSCAEDGQLIPRLETDPRLERQRFQFDPTPDASDFTTPQEDGIPPRVSGLPQFVTLRDGAYFLLPSLRALRYFAEVGNAQK